jgi:soluble lytic murein transglycosylase
LEEAVTVNWRKKLFAGTGFVGACAAALFGVATAQGLVPSVLPPAAPQDAGQPGPRPYSALESSTLRQAIEAARAGDVTGAKLRRDALTDPLARRIATWAIVDANSTSLSFFDLDAARRDLMNWPRQTRRNNAVEKSMEAASLSPTQVIAWFNGKDPGTAEGAMALASAHQSLGETAEAQALIKHVWRDEVFEADAQSRMLARFGSYLTAEDHAKRLDLLLYGAQGPASRAMMDLVDTDTRALAEARIALRTERADAPQIVDRLPASVSNAPGLAFERARYFRKKGLDTIAASYVDNFPAVDIDNAPAVWNERRLLMNAALKAGDYKRAYAMAADNKLPHGADFVEAEFFAGWLALAKLKDPAKADSHFSQVLEAGATPITLSRGYYWRGRAADAAGDAVKAKSFWAEGAKYYTAFYGQLSAERMGQSEIALAADPVPTAADRARFEARDMVRAARMLGDMGQKDLFRTFVLALQDSMPSAEELALLVDMARMYGDQDLAMRVVRAGATRGLYLPERGYPVRNTPKGEGMSEPALTHAIIRQESGFDPAVGGGAGARGLMQLMPATAQGVAKKLGVGYSADRLNDPDYNAQLGAAYLGSLVERFNGSYVMAAAGYNAGPGRSSQWAADCGDPRAGGADPADFIECIPFSETRNYVMRIMEGLAIYKARLNGGTAPLTASADLKRGGWTPAPTPTPVATLVAAQ